MRTLLLFVVLTASGLAAELKLDSAAIDANKQAQLSLRLESGGSELTGIQFDIEYDASRVDVKMEIGPAAEGAVKVLQSNTLQPGKQRVLIFGFNQTRLADGVVALARVTLKGSAEPDQTWPVRISQTTGTSAAGEAIPLKGSPGGVRRAGGTQSPARSKAQ